MILTQISVFLENKKGRLAEVTALIGGKGINIRALSLADTADFGVLRMIVNDPEKCFSVLRNGGFVAQKTEVIAAEVEDRPGGLQRVLAAFERHSINIEYMYAFVEKKSDNAIVVFRIDQPALAVKALESEGIMVLSKDIISKL
jgi:hypothetical protein